jgi:hypothetical protein
MVVGLAAGDPLTTGSMWHHVTAALLVGVDRPLQSVIGSTKPPYTAPRPQWLRRTGVCTRQGTGLRDTRNGRVPPHEEHL